MIHGCNDGNVMIHAFGWLAHIKLSSENRILDKKSNIFIILGHLKGNDNIQHLKIKHFMLNIYICST